MELVSHLSPSDMIFKLKSTFKVFCCYYSLLIILNYVYMCRFLHVSVVPQRSDDGLRSPGAAGRSDHLSTPRL